MTDEEMRQVAARIIADSNRKNLNIVPTTKKDLEEAASDPRKANLLTARFQAENRLHRRYLADKGLSDYQNRMWKRKRQKGPLIDA